MRQAQGQALRAQRSALSPNQRERLLGGMTQGVARNGYAGATLARIVEAAGVSRATFYEHFAGKEECFAAAHRRIVSCLRAEAGRAAVRSAPPQQRVRALLAALLRAAAADPAAARLLLVEALAAGPFLRPQHERAIAEAERAITRLLAESGKFNAAVAVPPLALLGGVAGVVSTSVLAGEDEELPGLLEPLLAWVESYAPSTAWAPWEDNWIELGQGIVPDPDGGAERVALLPRGRGAVPAAEASRMRRRRILDATARLCAQRGYAALTVADIVEAARVSRGVFYSSFRGKEDAFCAAQTIALEESIGAAAAAFFSAEEWPERVWRAGAALLSFGARNPALTFMWVVESHAAGATAIRRQEDARNAYAIFLEEGFRQTDSGKALPRIASDAIGWAVFALTRRELVEGRAARLPQILPQTAYLILAPFIGPEAAMEFVRARSRSGGRAAAAKR